MKTYLASLFLVLGISTGIAQENDTPEFNGDNFSLEGALAMFKRSASLESFEKAINEENNNVNNLDLNNDGDIDYITVEDIMEGTNHVVVLSAQLGDNEKQDVATINIEKTGNEEAHLQILGDEDLYDENTVAEPFDVEEKAIEGKGPSAIEVIPTRIIVNVWGWPCVRFVYAPSYRVWVSPFRWANYPRWWRPWKPYRHSIFIGKCAPHRVYFHRTRKVIIKHGFYSSRRKSSTIIVKNRRGTTVIRKGRGGRVRAVHYGGGRRR
ncbi:MAG: hypothetical protein QM535_07915 [Limnohabitans sp.]|nr:hypothetical protein [Limnohabitans sp.]